VIGAFGRSLSAALIAAAVSVLLGAQARPVSPPRPGTIAGHIAFAGKPPGNPIIRMGMDPKCADMNRGRQVIQEQAMVTADGSVANAFVRLEGTFPPTPVPPTPVVIDQRSCVYGPRVAGMRVGQRLQIRNDDDLLHNVHSSSAASNSFNVGQPKAGAMFEYTPKSPEVMLRLGCDVHRWMVAFVGVMPHPYFAVSDARGQYQIAHVPPGTYTIKSWHEQFGERTATVTVKAGGKTAADLSYGIANR
jgi:plastocyanin